MDTDLDQLSPSKTRQRTAQAHQLNTLTLWLANLISSSSHPQSQFQLTDPSSNPDSLPPHLSHWRSETTSHPDGLAILAALQTLRATNLRANEIQNLALEAAREEIGILQQHHNDLKQGFAPARELFETIKAGLNPDAREKLARLARAGVVLDLQPNTSFELGEDDQSQRETEREDETLETRFTKAVLAQCSRMIELHRQIAVSDHLRAQINQQIQMQMQTQTQTQTRQDEISHARQAGLSSSAASTDPHAHPHAHAHTSSSNNSTTISISISNDDDEIHQATSNLNHATKSLTPKTSEYRARIHALERQLRHLRTPNDTVTKLGSKDTCSKTTDDINDAVQIDIDMENLTHLHRRTGDRKIRVNALEDRIQALGGLPPDLEVARAEVRRAQSELEMWRGRREEVFGLVGGG